MPPNEYSEYFGPSATLHPPVVSEKENHNTPRFLEQVLPAPHLPATHAVLCCIPKMDER